MGTPQSLEALVYQLALRPVSEHRAIIRDYLAQGFGVFTLKHPEQNDLLMEVFNHLIRERANGKEEG